MLGINFYQACAKKIKEMGGNLEAAIILSSIDYHEQMTGGEALEISFQYFDFMDESRFYDAVTFLSENEFILLQSIADYTPAYRLSGLGQRIARLNTITFIN